MIKHFFKELPRTTIVGITERRTFRHTPDDKTAYKQAVPSSENLLLPSQPLIQLLIGQIYCDLSKKELVQIRWQPLSYSYLRIKFWFNLSFKANYNRNRRYFILTFQNSYLGQECHCNEHK